MGLTDGSKLGRVVGVNDGSGGVGVLVGATDGADVGVAVGIIVGM